jgi:hypothetical protein
MAKVIGFPQSPLSLFLGEWIRDPISVSRNKVAKRILGAEGLTKLWAFGSMAEMSAYLALDPELAEKYRVLAGMSPESRLVIAPQTMTWNNSGFWSNSGIASLPATTSKFQIVKAVAEGKKVIAETIELTGARRGQRIGYVLRMNQQWLLASEQYYGTQARLFPQSPVFRYYRWS